MAVLDPSSDDGLNVVWGWLVIVPRPSSRGACCATVVARALRRMVVDADGAAAHVEAEPTRAALAFAAVEQTGRDALAETRRLRSRSGRWSGGARVSADTLSLVAEKTSI
jgi:hypothetical protein